MVLQYHKLHPELRDEQTITPGDLARQLKWLKTNGYQSITACELYDAITQSKRLPEKPILLTFDGGHVSQYRHALSILENHFFHAVFFITVESVLESYRRDNRQADHHMGIDQLRHLAELGFEIGLLGYTHDSYNRTTLTSIQATITKAAGLFTMLDLPLTNVLAFPGGTASNPACNLELLDNLLHDEKIMLAFVNGNEIGSLETLSRFSIPRMEVKGRKGENIFADHIKP